MQKLIARHLYRRSLISYLMLPWAGLNWLVQKLRRRLPRTQYRSAARIISVGNIVSGGSGKTPTTIYLAKLLQAAGKSVAVSHRGYKGKFEANPTLLSDRDRVFDFAAQAGDEAYLLADKLAGIPVIAGKNRVAAIKILQQQFPGLQYIILDDSFQHLRVKHDYDIIVFNALGQIGNGWLLPAGILREPLSALKYADQIIYNGAGELPKFLKEQDLPSARAHYKISRFRDAKGKTLSIPTLQNSKIALLSAIGVPQSFAATIHNCGLAFQQHFAFADHDDFSDLAKLHKIAEQKFDFIIITEKDWAKLKFISHNLPIVVAESEFEIENLELENILSL
ncbi:MAG: tetraacyldisaccharide 4'-kinase [Candidatus Cloacimonadales bacterium]